MSNGQAIYKCTNCQTQECQLTTFDPSVPPPAKCAHGFKSTWRLQHTDPTTPLIVWEDPEVDPVAAVLQLQKYFERTIGRRGV